MPATAITAQPLILAFTPSNQLVVNHTEAGLALPFFSENALLRLEKHFPAHTPPAKYFVLPFAEAEWQVAFVQIAGPLPPDGSLQILSIEQLEKQTSRLSPLLGAVLSRLDPYLIEIPYLHLGENDYIYKFRVEKDRNKAIYQQDEAAHSLYQSKLCEAIKALARTNERTATQPAVLDFGAVSYVIPSHFGFCLGVKNAIERAYESLAENPGRRVFMLSELIHNPFVNEDLLRRGLRYLQSDKGAHYLTEESKADAAATPTQRWDTLTSDDVVIIPAFGATDEDKKRLVRKGIRVAQYDATCMLVEKVWKAARTFGREGYTIIIHGKSEHEETKATFSNSRRHAHSLIIRNLREAQLLGSYIARPTEESRQAILEKFTGMYTPGFDPQKDLNRIAIVNQTTLLMNETAAIIDYFKSVYSEIHGEAEGVKRVGGAGRKDTLCYATQVNQDALSRALEEPLDAAFIIGGKNSSNTYQLYRLCEQKLGNRAFFIQSEANILSRQEIEHYVFPSAGHGTGGHTEIHPLWIEPSFVAKRVLITGGASCPDGLVQQVINRINSLFPADGLHSMDQVLAKLKKP
jgi:4-hydroxy-3-methylbut-2-enyl diphosphate reductase